MPFSGSLEGAADLKLFGVQTELSKSRHAWLVVPCKMKCNRLEMFVGLKGVRMVNRSTNGAGFDRRPWRLSNTLAVSCLANGSMTSSQYTLLCFKSGSSLNMEF